MRQWAPPSTLVSCKSFRYLQKAQTTSDRSRLPHQCFQGRATYFAPSGYRGIELYAYLAQMLTCRDPIEVPYFPHNSGATSPIQGPDSSTILSVSSHGGLTISAYVVSDPAKYTEIEIK